MKNIIITGASDGLGEAFSKLCLKENINIIAIGRRKPQFDCTFIQADLKDEKEIISACNEIKEKYNKFDAFINCAGAMTLSETSKIDATEAREIYMVNSIAPIIFISQLHNLIIENNADILNVVSMMSTLFDINRDSVIYSSSKWALRGASYCLESEFRDTPCRVITFNPGGMNTNLFKKYSESLSELGTSWMNPADIAEIMLYTLKLPKQVEVTDIAITRKPNYKIN